MRFYDLKNADAIRDELVDMIRDFDREMNMYETDVYLYVDEDGYGRLETFANPGGNSWINDDHYVLYTDKQHYEDVLDTYTVKDIADVLGMEVWDLKAEIGDPKNIDDADVYEYVRQNEKYFSLMKRDYEERLDEIVDYEEIADAAIEIFDQEREYAEEQAAWSAWF